MSPTGHPVISPVNNGEDFKDRLVIQLCTTEELKGWIPIGTMEQVERMEYSNVFGRQIQPTSGGVGKASGGGDVYGDHSNMVAFFITPKQRCPRLCVRILFLNF